MRDAMTPLGLWSIGPPPATAPAQLASVAASTRAVAVRFVALPWLLAALGGASVALVALGARLEPELHGLVLWRRAGVPAAASAAMGVAGALCVALPVVAVSGTTPFDAVRHAAGAFGDPLYVVSVLALAMGGNLMEEYLFRGWLQGLLKQSLRMTGNRAAAASAVAFCFFHAELATTVRECPAQPSAADGQWSVAAAVSAQVGCVAPVLVFTLYEAAVCAALRERCGLQAAVLAHGLAIFILALS